MTKLIKYDKTYYNVALSYCWKELFFVYNIYNILFHLLILKKKPRNFYRKLFFISIFNFNLTLFTKHPIKSVIRGIKSFFLGIHHSIKNRVTTYNGSFPNLMYKCGIIFTLPILFIYNPKLFGKELINGFLNKFAFFKKF